jgi:hypothetical protein
MKEKYKTIFFLNFYIDFMANCNTPGVQFTKYDVQIYIPC